MDSISRIRYDIVEEQLLAYLEEMLVEKVVPAKKEDSARLAEVSRSSAI